jgi:hypothetical protein
MAYLYSKIILLFFFFFFSPSPYKLTSAGIMLELAPSPPSLVLLPITFANAISLRRTILEAVVRSLESTFRNENNVEMLINVLGRIIILLLI